MDFDYLVRQLEGSDQSFLWEALYHSLYVPPDGMPFPRDVLKQPKISMYVDSWGRKHDLGFVAVNRNNGDPIGAAWLRLMAGSERGYAYIDDETPEIGIAVLPGFRGRGIGSELLKCLLELAGSAYTKVCLSVSPDNPAHRLYERFGFVQVRVDDTSVIMVKSLTGSTNI